MHKKPEINIFNFGADTRAHKKPTPIQRSANTFTKTLCVL